MKSIKAILFVVALACTMLINYACNPDKKTGDAKITVNTAAIYDELGITGPIPASTTPGLAATTGLLLSMWVTRTVRGSWTSIRME